MKAHDRNCLNASRHSTNKMTYNEAIEYLFNVAPMFQNIGAGAYKEGLSNTKALDEHFQHPHNCYRTIHVAGTNGKGSTCHTLASILQQAGYRVGLYTSPHLVDFRERIRVNGQMIPEQRVIDFVEKERNFFEPLYPSFFELTTALALQYFKEQHVDVAVIEVGLGGRLDCTNIIQPALSVITNISYDHTQFLGNTLEKIAAEKAGIIKPGVPIVIGETNGNEGVKNVFQQTAQEEQTSIWFADEANEVLNSHRSENSLWEYNTSLVGKLCGTLSGECQPQNTATILCALSRLREAGFSITDEDIRMGFANVCTNTGLMGRWQTVNLHPQVVCDIAHNPAGLHYIGQQLNGFANRSLHIVIGMVNDKDVSHSLAQLPKQAKYYFTQASVKRAMPAEELATIAGTKGLHGNTYPNVNEAFKAAMHSATADDFIYIGGSTFVVADFMQITRD